MASLDLVIRNATVATSTATFDADLGVADGVIVELGSIENEGAREIDATDKLVLPGGIDSHTHIEQLSAAGVMNADDFHSATVSAAFGGTTTTMSFAAQHRGMRIPEVVADYHERAASKAVIDYAFHLIVADPTPETLGHDLPLAIAGGVASLKLYMTYDRLMVDDAQILDVLTTARANGALTMVHAENHGMIGWMSDRVVSAGNTLPRYHAVCHTRGAEAEAIHRLVALSELADAPVLVVHVSTVEGIEEIRRARARGLKVYGETCPQYLFLTSDDLDRGGLDGAMFCCSPPPRDAEAQEACWAGLLDGTLQVYSSDHAPFRFDASGKLPNGERTTFKEIANGVPGLELRLPVLYTEGVASGRLTINQFVDITSTQHAKIYGLYPAKGTIAVGSDADFAIWDTNTEREITHDMVHDNVGYTPYAGRQLTAWPETVVSRGDVIVENGELDRGSRAWEVSASRSPGLGNPVGPGCSRDRPDGGVGHTPRPLAPHSKPASGLDRPSAPQPRESEHIVSQRSMVIAAAQLGPVNLDDTRQSAVARLVDLLRTAASRGAEFVVFPELAFTTFFPRWWLEDQGEIDARFFESSMPSTVTQPLFDAASELGVGFTIGYGELTTIDGETRRFNTSVLVAPDGSIIGRYRKIHLPGHADHKPDAAFQHLEKKYFEVGNLGFPVYRYLDSMVGMLICNDRRWPEAFRVLGLQGAEIVALGFNTPTENLHYPEPPAQRVHQHLIMAQAMAYQNSVWLIETAKAGFEDGFRMFGNSVIVAPTGEIVAKTTSEDDEVIVHQCDLSLGDDLRRTMFNLAAHRRPEHYGLIVERTGVEQTPAN